MKKWKILITALAGMVLCSSCVTSLHPLVTYDKVVNEDRITGTWSHEDMNIRIDPLLQSEFFRAVTRKDVKDGKSPFKGEDKNDSLFYTKSYVFTFKKEGINQNMLGSFTTLNGELYIDLVPVLAYLGDTLADSGPSTDLLYPGIKESHTFARVKFYNNNQVEFMFLSPDFILKWISGQRVAIKHEKDEMTGALLITASSSDLQKFLMKYGRDERLYKKENNITLDKIK